MEIWKDITGYEGIYQVSTYGRVRSMNYNGSHIVKEIKQSPNNCGYLRVVLYKNGESKKFFTHRLVAEAFIPNWFDDPQVNHRDEDKTNNHIDNLEYCDAKYNNSYGTRIKRMVETVSKPILQFSKTCEFVREWPSSMELRRNGYNGGNIIECCLGKRKTADGFIWKYKD